MRNRRPCKQSGRFGRPALRARREPGAGRPGPRSPAPAPEQPRQGTSAAIFPAEPQLYENYPDVFADLFGQNGPLLLDPQWITQNNGGGTKVGNNAGLIRFGWLRQGLATLLADRRFWGFQLAHFVQGKVNAAVKAHAEHGLRLEVTLATMIGIANSYGGAGMRGKFLQPALDAFPNEGAWLPRELKIVKQMLRTYADRDLQSHPKTQQLFAVGLDGQPGELPTPGSLAHRGNRVLATLKLFPLSPPVEFSGLGHFLLPPESCFAGDPTTA